MRLIVISDLHIGAGQLDDFDHELEQHLCRFLTTLSKESAPIELVINGDFLEFVQAPPWDVDGLESTSHDGQLAVCFSESQSRKKLQAIITAHHEIFKRLETFLEAGHWLTILPGNHDVDFFWKGVRDDFTEVVCNGREPLRERLTIHLERVYRPPGFAGLWIEHGHQFDELNSFRRNGKDLWSNEHPPIATSKEGVERLVECLGTRLLIQYLNRLDSHYPLVDNIKPFGRFVKTFAASALSSPSASLTAAVSTYRLLRFLGNVGLSEPAALLHAAGEPDADMKTPLEAITQRLRELAFDGDALNERVHGANFPDSIPVQLMLDDEEKTEALIAFLDAHPDILSSMDDTSGSVLSEDGEGTLSLWHGYTVDETSELVKGARSVLHDDPSVTMIIMGHTHEFVVRPEHVPYLNTGCWIRYYREAKDSPPPPWSLLRNATYSEFPYSLQYAAVDSSNVGAATLETFAERAS